MTITIFSISLNNAEKPVRIGLLRTLHVVHSHDTCTCSEKPNRWGFLFKLRWFLQVGEHYILCQMFALIWRVYPWHNLALIPRYYLVVTWGLLWGDIRGFDMFRTHSHALFTITENYSFLTCPKVLLSL